MERIDNHQRSPRKLVHGTFFVEFFGMQVAAITAAK